MLLKQEKLYRYILIIQILLLFIMPPLTQMESIWGVITYGVFGVLSVIFMGIYLISEKKVITKASIFVLVFFLMIILSACWGMFSYGTPLSDAVRGIIPFSWYIYILVLQFFNLIEYRKFINIVAICSVLFAIRIIGYYIYYVICNGGGRVTYFLANATAIITIVGVIIFASNILLLNVKGKSLFLNILGLIINCSSIVMTETKSMIISMILGLVVIMVLNLIQFHNNKEIKRIFFRCVLVIGIVAIVVSLLFVTSGLNSRWNDSFNAISEIRHTGNSDDGSVGIRIEEYRMAIENWQDSPAIGKGIGYRWVDENINYGGPVQFVHNVIMYILMDLGIVGILFLLLIIFAIIRMLCSFLKYNNGDNDFNMFYLSFAVLIVAFVYANFFAIYRNIEFTVLVALFLSCMIRISSRIKSERENENRNE